MSKQYYNEELKLDFLNSIVSEHKSYAHTYRRLFRVSSKFEDLHKKDLTMFTNNDILTMLSFISKNLKYTTVLAYNSLIKNYKEWAKANNKEAILETCTVAELKSIKNFKQYVILNDMDIRNMTENAVIDGSAYNIVLFIKLFWEIDGQESVNDVLNIKIDDLNVDKRTIKIRRNADNANHIIVNEYQISQWLTGYISEFAGMTEVEFRNKNGNYKILSAEENDGLIFRTTFTKKTVVGMPIDGVKFSNMLYQYCERYLDESITINDLLMSLALRHMLVNKKSHTQMYTQQRYFKNLPSSVYKTVFEENAEEKYPILYSQYVQHYKNLESIYIDK